VRRRPARRVRGRAAQGGQAAAAAAGPVVRAGVLAHGIGGRSDLPIPFALAVVASAVVLVVSFAALAVLWPTPRLRGARAGRPVPSVVAAVLDSPVSRWLVRLVGLAFFGSVLAAALFGIDDALNPTAGVVFVMF